MKSNIPVSNNFFKCLFLKQLLKVKYQVFLRRGLVDADGWYVATWAQTKLESYRTNGTLSSTECVKIPEQISKSYPLHLLRSTDALQLLLRLINSLLIRWEMYKMYKIYDVLKMKMKTSHVSHFLGHMTVSLGDILPYVYIMWYHVASRCHFAIHTVSCVILVCHNFTRCHFVIHMCHVSFCRTQWEVIAHARTRAS